MYFNADKLLASIGDGTLWNQTLLTQSGQIDIKLSVLVDNEWKEHVPEGYDDEWGCVPGEDSDLDDELDDGSDGEFDNQYDEEEYEERLEEYHEQNDEETTEEESDDDEATEENDADANAEDGNEDDCFNYVEEQESLYTEVKAADESVGVTIADLKKAIRTLRATKYKGPWMEGHDAHLTIRGCVVETAQCVVDARAWAAGTYKGYWDE